MPSSMPCWAFSKKGRGRKTFALRPPPIGFAESSCRLGRLVLDHLGPATADLDRAGLHGLRNLADQFDAEHAVHQIGAGDLDVVGQLQPALERAARDAPIEVLFLLGRLLLPARVE